ncbi:hypothetical protein V2J82_13290 [Pseudomonas alliivorans]|nr:hypothetical protein [Pseudomonas alliivorans]
MENTTRYHALNSIFNDPELSESIEKGLTSLTNSQFLEAYKAMVKDKDKLLIMVDVAKAKARAPSPAANIVKSANVQPETDLERTTRILQEKYGKK